MGSRDSVEPRVAAIRRALALVIEALDTLDGFDGSPTAAAHLDMAITALRETLAGCIASEQATDRSGS